MLMHGIAGFDGIDSMGLPNSNRVEVHVAVRCTTNNSGDSGLSGSAST